MEDYLSNFGVIVTCSKDDYIFAHGCCASIRFYMKNVPICLLVDGPHYGHIVEVYNASVITKRDVDNIILRDNSFGWGLTKMIAFWYSPFKYFMLLDADTALWGDIRKFLDFSNYDIIIDKPRHTYDLNTVNSYFFDTERIKDLYPDFNHESHPYACTGVIIAKKNSLDLNAYLDFLEMKKSEPEVFKFGEQGWFNFYIFYAKEKGKLRVGNKSIQFIVGDYTRTEMMNLFSLREGSPVNNGVDIVIHWAGASKPLLQNPSGYYTEPMIFFRRKFYQEKGYKLEDINIILEKEDRAWERNNPIEKNFWHYKKRLKFYLKISKLCLVNIFHK